MIEGKIRMKNPAQIRKWLINIAAPISSVGIAFLIVEELNKTAGTVLLVIGICLFIASNFFRAGKGRKD